ncbi:hypothetical protein KUCAC02_033489 [Chaenocephalus aceratus]|nr:hypothetical protein KUCAC02_033489 [Chaenocephalus aceratus]
MKDYVKQRFRTVRKDAQTDGTKLLEVLVFCINVFPGALRDFLRNPLVKLELLSSDTMKGWRYEVPLHLFKTTTSKTLKAWTERVLTVVQCGVQSPLVMHGWTI